MKFEEDFFRKIENFLITRTLNFLGWENIISFQQWNFYIQICWFYNRNTLKVKIWITRISIPTFTSMMLLKMMTLILSLIVENLRAIFNLIFLVSYFSSSEAIRRIFFIWKNINVQICSHIILFSSKEEIKVYW